MENPSRIETPRRETARTPQPREADSLVRVERRPACWPKLIAGGSEPFEGSEHDGQVHDDLDQLIQLAQAGDRGALNRLMAWTRPRLVAVAMRTMCDRDDAEDVAQEALLKVCRYLTRFEGRSAFATWIHRITINTGLDWLRRQQARHERAAADRTAERDEAAARPDAVDAIDEETPERAYVRAEAGAAVQGAIARLTPSHAETLALREIDGESYQSIAAIVRCPVGTVMSRLHHARRRLAVELDAQAAA